tara:strand:+ start:1276 stop:1428 length:153 start_codon:yes stop_codon:yes gene_type:complete
LRGVTHDVYFRPEDPSNWTCILNYQELKDVFEIIKETGSYKNYHIFDKVS